MNDFILRKAPMMVLALVVVQQFWMGQSFERSLDVTSMLIRSSAASVLRSLV